MTAPARARASPFKGLMSYTEADAAFFFGRDEEIEIVIANLEARRLTLLYGTSGVGKSSLLDAGVVHRLRERARRNLAEIGTPELIPVYFSSWRDDPLVELLEAIRESVSDVLGEPAHEPSPSARLDEALDAWSAQADADVLVVLDQFEEYFAYHGRDRGERTFAAELTRAVNRPHLRARFLLSLREDALAKLDRFKHEIPTLFGTYLRLRYLTRASAEQAIRRPIDEFNEMGASDGRVDVEDALVDAVLDEVRAGRVLLEQSGRGVIESEDASDGDGRVETAYLQLVMARIWGTERRHESLLLRRSTLEALGGSETIVRTHLDEALGELPVEDQDLVADVFHHLVTPSGTKIAHAPSDLAAYTGHETEEILPVLERLSTAGTRILRPVSTGNGPPRYEIFHDVLGAAVLDWRIRHVQARLERDKAAAEERADHEVSRARMFRALAIAAVAALLAFVVVTVVAFLQWRRANEQTARVESRLIASSARDLLDTRLDLAIPLALEAYDRAHGQNFEARSVLLAAAHRSARLLRVVRPPGRLPIVTAAFEPGSGRLATGDARGVSIWSPERSVVHRLKGRDVDSLSFSADGRLLASSDDDGVSLWDTTTWRRIWHNRHLGDVALSADKSWLAAEFFHNGPPYYTVWTLDGGKPRLADESEYLGYAAKVAFSPGDPDLLAVVRDQRAAGRLELLRLPSLRLVAVGPRHVTAMAFGPKGQLLALATDDKRIQLWSLLAHKPVGDPLVGHTAEVTSLAFSTDGKTLASAGRDRSVILWDVSHPKDVHMLGKPLRAHVDWISAVTFAGDVVAAASADGTLSFWDAARRRSLATMIPLAATAYDAELSPDGRLLASADYGGKLTIWDVARRRTRFRAAKPLGRLLLLSPDAARLLTTVETKSREELRLWDTTTGARVDLPALALPDKVAFAPDGSLVTATSRYVRLRDRAGHSRARMKSRGIVSALAVSPDGQVIAWGLEDGRVAIWRPSTHRPAEVRKAHRFSVEALAFSPDGRLLAAGSTDLTVSLWNVDSGRLAGTLVGHDDAVNTVAFSRDGTTLASGSEDSTVRLWDVETRRPLGEPLPTPDPVSELAFGPGELVALTYDEILLWDKSFWSVDFAALRKRLCGLVGELDSAEWDQVLPGKPREQPCAQ